MIDHIKCTSIAKRFQFEWVFRELNYQLESDQIYGILGPNGSGKSTFLKIISGFTTPTKGDIKYNFQGRSFNQSEIFQYIAYTAPYIDLIEEMTVNELINFHHKMRPFPNFDLLKNEIKSFPFKNLLSKRIYELSSGMKQRIKLVTAILSGAKILLLDEPGSNLDVAASQWWQELLELNKLNRIILIASNDPADLHQVTQYLEINNYKNKIRNS